MVCEERTSQRGTHRVLSTKATGRVWEKKAIYRGVTWSLGNEDAEWGKTLEMGEDDGTRLKRCREKREMNEC